MSASLNSAVATHNQGGVKRPWYYFWTTIDIDLRYAAIAIVFSFGFVNFFISTLGIDFWPDVRAYENNFRDAYYYYQALQAGPVDFFTKELLWLYLVRWIMDFNLTTVQALYIISLASCALLAYFLLLNTRKVYSLALLLNPIFVDFIIGQGRSSFAIAIFFTALMVRSELLRIAMIVAASAIHFSVPLFAAFYYFFVFTKRWSEDLRIGDTKWVWFLIAATVAFGIEFVRVIILSALNDSRADVQLDRDSSLLLAFGFLLFLATYAVSSRDRKASFAYFFYAVNALLFLFATFKGIYASRYVAVAYPMLCMMQANQPRLGQLLLAAHMLAFSAVYFVFWLN